MITVGSPATSPEERNWAGDMQQPNGDIEQTCPHCGLSYKGFLRRKMCRACKKLKLHFPSIFTRKATTV